MSVLPPSVSFASRVSTAWLFRHLVPATNFIWPTWSVTTDQGSLVGQIQGCGGEGASKGCNCHQIRSPPDQIRPLDGHHDAGLVQRKNDGGLKNQVRKRKMEH